MKTIYRIAKTELFTLFYSPVAWLVLVIFAFQANLAFSDFFCSQLKSKSLGYPLWDITNGIFTGGLGLGLFTKMQSVLFLYMPLLTMGLVSRELKSGSIKLLFSSPISNVKIILGKYTAMLIYCLLLILVLAVTVFFSATTINNFDLPLVLSGLLGLYLLICSYAAIGLFMSCLTSYQVVSAMGTLAVLAVLNFIGGVGQDIAFVRDITYWLSISGRAYEFIKGLICSEDVLYFLIVISLFVIFSIIKLDSKVKCRSKISNTLRYCGVLFIAILLGYFSIRPSFMLYHDASYTQANTLTPNSQDVIGKLDGDLTIVTYVNVLDNNCFYGLPAAIKGDQGRFKQYLRFKPDIKMKYVYYYDKVHNPYLYNKYPNLSEEDMAKKVAEIYDLDFDTFLSSEEIREIIDLKPEGNKFVRQLVRENGQTSWLRIYSDNWKHPRESEITAAFKRFIVESPKIGFLTGHGERTINRNRSRDYSSFVNNRSYRNSMINQGFDGVNVSVSGNNDIPEDISVLVLADLREPLNSSEIEKLNNYISKGGNMIIAGEPERRSLLNPFIEQFGVKLMKGNLVQKIEDVTPNILAGNFTDEATKFSYRIEQTAARGYKIALPGTAGLSYKDNGDFKIMPLLVSNDSLSWNELETEDFLEEPTLLNPNIGEVEKSYVAALALSRKKANKEQRIMIFGDSDFISNGELARARNKIGAKNMEIIPGIFEWMSYGAYPIDTRRPRTIDDDISLGYEYSIFVKILFIWIIPLLLIFSGCYIWFKRKTN